MQTPIVCVRDYRRHLADVIPRGHTGPVGQVRVKGEQVRALMVTVTPESIVLLGGNLRISQSLLESSDTRHRHGTWCMKHEGTHSLAQRRGVFTIAYRSGVRSAHPRCERLKKTEAMLLATIRTAWADKGRFAHGQTRGHARPSMIE